MNKLQKIKELINIKLEQSKDAYEINRLNQCLNLILIIESGGTISAPLVFSTHSGKMENMISISSYQYLNDLCKNYQKKDRMICSRCYVKKFEKLYNRLDPVLIYNFIILNYSKIDPAIYKELFNVHYIRFEAFGDIASVQHLENFVNLAKYYKNSNFAVWSKNYSLLDSYLKNHKIPKNLNLIVSSPLINEEINSQFINRLLSYNTIKKSNLKVFTVYTKDQHANAGGANCEKKCITCLKCYEKNNIKKIKEVLK